MILWMAGALSYLRCFFWRQIVRCFGGDIKGGTRIYESVKICTTKGSPVFVGKNCSLEKGAVVSTSNSGRISIGDGVYLGEYVVLSSKAEIEIGDNSLLAPHTVVVDFDHSIGDPKRLISKQGVECKKVTIGKGVWIGAGCRILKGVMIGEGCVVGAGSVVTKDLPPFSVCVGVPAQVLRERNQPPVVDPFNSETRSDRATK